MCFFRMFVKAAAVEICKHVRFAVFPKVGTPWGKSPQKRKGTHSLLLPRIDSLIG